MSGLADEAFLRKPPSATYPLTPDRSKTPAERAVRRLALKGGLPVHGRRPHPYRHARPLTLTSCPASTGHLLVPRWLRPWRLSPLRSSSPAPTGDLMPNVILISIHINAAGDGTKWMNATGWSCYTCKGQTGSDILAACLYEAAIKNFPGKRIRTDYSDNDPDWEENSFMDNKKDFAYLISDEGKRNLINTIIQGITSYCMKKVDNQSF